MCFFRFLLKNDISHLCKEFEKISREQNENYLDSFEKEKKSIYLESFKQVSGSLFCYNVRRR